MSEKLCVFCVYLRYDPDTGGDYAEPAQLQCEKGHALRPNTSWQAVYDVEDFRKMILTAKDCSDYKEAK